MAGTYNIQILQGETFHKEIVWRDKSGNIVDLTGYSAKMQIRTAKTGGTVIVELSTVNGKIVIDSNHLITLTIPSEDTAYMNFVGSAVYDLELMKNSVVKRLIQGTATLDLGVTI